MNAKFKNKSVAHKLLFIHLTKHFTYDVTFFIVFYFSLKNYVQ